MRVGIIGAGFVGATTAYARVMRGVVSDIVLVDIDEERAEAEASDVLHAVPFAHSASVGAGPYSDLDGSEIVVITAS
jgi:L-lactate dehydrogenase